ncbi:hypothetical protein EVAR_22328_1 [Eumeta japonica]|uniref:Uncharacterized protein n=1 Tax=Eumeta variegata TaxID=151549 RepID=A0A4C1UAV3_EUMVA|nr:hypothetical protein EVAR_22328_1 [Eumeta japonica]
MRHANIKHAIVERRRRRVVFTPAPFDDLFTSGREVWTAIPRPPPPGVRGPLTTAAADAMTAFVADGLTCFSRFARVNTERVPSPFKRADPAFDSNLVPAFDSGPGAGLDLVLSHALDSNPDTTLGFDLGFRTPFSIFVPIPALDSATRPGLNSDTAHGSDL